MYPYSIVKVRMLYTNTQKWLAEICLVGDSQQAQLDTPTKQELIN